MYAGKLTVSQRKVARQVVHQWLRLVLSRTHSNALFRTVTSGLQSNAKAQTGMSRYQQKVCGLQYTWNSVSCDRPLR